VIPYICFLEQLSALSFVPTVRRVLLHERADQLANRSTPFAIL